MKISSLQKGLVGHWTMSQDSLKGSLLADKTPYENDGTIYGATFTTDRKGKANSAMSFNGTSDYIDCGDGDSLAITSAITMSCWIKGNTGNTDMPKFMSKRAGSNFYFIGLKSKKPYIGIGDGTVETLIADNAIDNDNWHFIVGTFYNNTKEANICVDNVSRTTIFSNSIGNLSGHNLKIGAEDKGYNFYDGSIADVRIYNRALSQDEITLLYLAYNPKIIL